MKQTMKQAVTLFSAALLTLGVSGCQRNPETSAKTQADVSDAQVEGEHEAAETRHDVAERTMDAQRDVNEANAELAHESAEGRRAIVVADAETAHNVATEKCETMTGDPRTDCKKQADLALEQAKLSADTRAQVTDPTR